MDKISYFQRINPGLLYYQDENSWKLTKIKNWWKGEMKNTQKTISSHCEFESEGNECCLRIQLSLCISNLNHPVRYETKGL